jgi:hypothetical protein
MIARLAGFVAVFVIAVLWTLGIVSQFHIADISLLNQTLGDCWMQLTLPLGFSILGLTTKRYWYLIAGCVVVISAVSNHSIPSNGFLESGGSWTWQVPILATLGGILIFAGWTGTTSFTGIFLPRSMYLQKREIAAQSPIILKLFLIYGVAAILVFLFTLVFGSYSATQINGSMPFFVAINVAMGFAFISLSTNMQIKRMMLAAIAVLLITACCAFTFSVGIALEKNLRIQITTMLIFGFLLLSPSMLKWMEFTNSRNSATQFTIVDLLYCTSVFAIGIVAFQMLG